MVRVDNKLTKWRHFEGVECCQATKNDRRIPKGHFFKAFAGIESAILGFFAPEGLRMTQKRKLFIDLVTKVYNLH